MPAELWQRWNLDPTLLAAMAVVAGLHVVLLRRDAEWAQKRQLFAAAWLLLFALFVSPLCALTSALFSARVTHHVILIAVVAPLSVAALPRRFRGWTVPASALGALIAVHILVLWGWHAPRLYEAASSEPPIFWIMQLTLLGTAIAVWLAVLSQGTGLVSALSMLLGIVMQMGLLGAIITFAPRALYAPHFGSTEPFGLSALEDQQLAGLIMWVPAILPYLAVALFLIGQHLSAGSRYRRAS